MKLKLSTRVMILISALLMIITYFVPIWQILMWAPQYPEGLEMKIWLDNITGDYKIISGLNHYIGMKHIDVDMFPEFQYMGYIVGFLIAAGILVFLINRKFALVTYALLILFAGAAGMVDFYQWGYDYGHNLDPTAPIVVPGMAYQPPIIGTKQLLNFTAYSAPDIGGYVFLVSGLIAIGCIIYEWRKQKTMTPSFSVGILALMILFSSCSTGPEPLNFGKDGCHACKMTLMDNKFGCEIVTTKGKTFKFDDVNCLASFMKSNEVQASDIAEIVIIDFADPGKLIDAKKAVFVASEDIKSPMASNIAAFQTIEKVRQVNEAWTNSIISWDEVIK